MSVVPITFDYSMVIDYMAGIECWFPHEFTDGTLVVWAMVLHLNLLALGIFQRQFFNGVCWFPTLLTTEEQILLFSPTMVSKTSMWALKSSQ